MQGKVLWISVRPERKTPLRILDAVQADTQSGLEGNRFSADHRQVTVIFREALERAADILGKPMEPGNTRRNVLVEGIPSDLEKGDMLRLGDVLVEVTGPCLPCSRMDETLGEGGRLALANAVAGGITAKILVSGKIAVGDTVTFETRGSGIPEREA